MKVTHQDQEEQYLYIDATITIEIDVRGVEYTYEGTYPDKELLSDHIAELFRVGAFGPIEDQVEIEITHIDE